MSDAGSESLSPAEGSPGSNESNISDDDMELDRETIQLYGCKCENWDDVYTILAEKSRNPQVLEKFLFLYPESAILEATSYFTGYGTISIEMESLKLMAKDDHDFKGASLMSEINKVVLPQKALKDPPLYSDPDLEALRLGFQAEYIDPYNLVGETVKEIKNNIDNYCLNPKKYVAPYTSLITSSMMGKLAWENESSGYPKPSSVLRDWINKGVMSQIRSYGYETYSDPYHKIPTFKFSIFLLVLIQELAKLVDDILSNHADRVDKMNPYLWMWDIFAEPVSSKDKERYADFWNSVVTEAKQMMDNTLRRTEITELTSSAYSYLRANFGTDVHVAYTNLKQAFRISSDKDFNLILICDEARILCDISAIDGKFIPSKLDFVSGVETLSSIETSYPPFSNIKALRRGLCYLQLAREPSQNAGSVSDKTAASSPRKGDMPLKNGQAITSSSIKNKARIPRIFALLTDTSSRLTNFQPTTWEDRSLRILGLPKLGHVQFEPIFTFTSIDAHSMYSNEPCTADVDSVANSTRLLKFGRAGWYSVARYLDTNPISLAMVKLVGGTQQWSKFFDTPFENRMDAKTRIALLAVLAPRLAVTAGPCVREADEIIASHLAILMMTDSDRHFFRSAYASEPILAEASAQMTDERGWGQVLRALYTNVQTGIVEGGFRGELLSKILCLMAVDKSQRGHTFGTWDFTHPVKVSDFLDNFIQPPGKWDKCTSVTAAIEAYAAVYTMDPALVDRFLNGHVFFNHFIRVEEDLTMPLLVQSWNRGAALMCKPYVEAIDHVIPVMLAPESSKPPKFGPLYGTWNETEVEEARQNVSYILINSRNYSKPHNHDGAALRMRASEENIKLSLNKDGQKSVLELHILQEFGPKQPRREHHTVTLLDPVDSTPPKQLTFVLKEISPTTYKCLEFLDGTVDGRMTLLYLEKLREAKGDYDSDLVKRRKVKRLAARHDSLPIVFGATSDLSMGYWNDSKDRMRDD